MGYAVIYIIFMVRHVLFIGILHQDMCPECMNHEKKLYRLGIYGNHILEVILIYFI